MPRIAIIGRLLFALLLIPAVSGCAFVNVSLQNREQPLREETVSGEGRDRILLLDIGGFISGGERRTEPIGGRRESSLVARVREALDKAAEDRRIKGVVLRINSPGGTVTASDMIHHEILAFRERRNIPIVASCLDLAASGAYYIAVASDRIIAQPTTIVGSIGVVMLRVNVRELLGKIGVEAGTIQSGPLKSMGSPLRPMTAEEERLFQGLIDSLHERFVQTVAAGRPKLKPEAVRRLADGRIYTATEAVEKGLVDGIGYLDDAVAEAKQLAGLSKARVVIYHRPDEYRGTVYSGPVIDWNAALEWALRPQALYLWVP